MLVGHSAPKVQEVFRLTAREDKFSPRFDSIIMSYDYGYLLCFHQLFAVHVVFGVSKPCP